MSEELKFIEYLEDNADWLGVDHVKEIRRCVQSEKESKKVYAIGGNKFIEVVISFVETNGQS